MGFLKHFNMIHHKKYHGQTPRAMQYHGLVEIPTVDQHIMQYTKAKYKIYFYNKLAEA